MEKRNEQINIQVFNKDFKILGNLDTHQQKKDLNKELSKLKNKQFLFDNFKNNSIKKQNKTKLHINPFQNPNDKVNITLNLSPVININNKNSKNCGADKLTKNTNKQNIYNKKFRLKESTNKLFEKWSDLGFDFYCIVSKQEKKNNEKNHSNEVKTYQFASELYKPATEPNWIALFECLKPSINNIPNDKLDELVKYIRNSRRDEEGIEENEN